jgi:hypothetical protein
MTEKLIKIIEFPKGIFTAKAIDDKGNEIARSNIWKDFASDDDAIDDLQKELKKIFV